jgi:uncharacterized protein YecE (DUF72 family)
MARFLVGTSGWNYQGWRGILYPPELPASRWLSYYAENFDTAEVNYSFYHLPRETTCENWYRQTPQGFVFALKASRFITHIKRLGGVKDSWNTFVERASHLKEKLGPILLQFPPSFHATPENIERMAQFLGYATGGSAPRIALEFRHASCFEAPMTDLLRRHQAALVIAHSVRYPVPETIATAPFAYFRFHGPEDMFASSYPGAQLREWSRPMKAFLETGTDVYAYFNNDIGGYAVMNARTLKRLVTGSTARAGRQKTGARR